MRAVILFLMLPTGGAIVWGTIDYLNDWLVVTNRRVMHQEKVLFINEWRKEAPLEQVQNVDFRSTWLGKILDYGTMTIATAATAGTITFDYTTHFRDLRETIIEQRKQRQRHTTAPVSYTHLDVYKRQSGSRTGASDPGSPFRLR